MKFITVYNNNYFFSQWAHLYSSLRCSEGENTSKAFFLFMCHMLRTLVDVYNEIICINYHSTPVCSQRTCLFVTLMRRTSVVHLHRRSWRKVNAHPSSWTPTLWEVCVLSVLFQLCTVFTIHCHFLSQELRQLSIHTQSLLSWQLSCFLARNSASHIKRWLRGFGKETQAQTTGCISILLRCFTSQLSSSCHFYISNMWRVLVK